MTTLNLAAFSARTQALGPGLRAVIWVQGCPFRCRGCIAPNWIPSKPVYSYTPEEIVAKINLDVINGFTFSGGEPMQQAEGLALVAQLARKKKDINIICFTGYKFERLILDPPNDGVLKLLNEVDVLVDGPYIESQNNSIGLRGSTNQRIIHLSSKLRGHDLEGQTRRFEVTVSDGELAFIGIPTPQINQALTKILHESVRGKPDERI